MNKLDSLRMTRSPSNTSAHSHGTSGASSPTGLPSSFKASSASNKLVAVVTDGRASLVGVDVGLGAIMPVGSMTGRSVPGTPHFGAQSEL